MMYNISINYNLWRYIVENSDKNKKSAKVYLSIGISLGVCLGSACGIIFNNLAICIGLGLCIGTSFGMIVQSNNDKKRH